MQDGAGHCLCGAIQFSFEGKPNWQAHCHCDSCRRNCAAPFTSFFGIDHGKWRWTGATPATYASTPGVTRHFCAACGTQMAYQSDSFSHEMHFYAATLTDPWSYTPQEHVHWDERLPWVHLNDGLPVRRSPHRLTGDEDMAPVLNLLHSAFAYMDGVIDPPSSLHRLDVGAIANHARTNEVWVLEEQQSPIACVFLTLRPHTLYVGKLAVAEPYQGQGLARQLMDLAVKRARARGLARLELESRVELLANHAFFAALGFEKTAETTHDGFAHPTSFTFSRTV
ncbi:MAG: GNAT family N-acetyltransferase [Albidovulum sp.]